MRRLILIITLLLIFIPGCDIPQQPTGEETPPSPLPSATQTAQAEPTTTESPTSPPPSPTSPPPTQPMDTSTPAPDRTSLPPLTKGLEVEITRIHMVTKTKGWAIGHQGTSHDHILYTQDGGRTWLDHTPPTTTLQNADQKIQAKGFFLDENHAWVKYFIQAPPPPLQAQFVWRTTDAGVNWQISQPLPLTGKEMYFTPTAFDFIDSSRGWLLVNIDAGMNHEYSNLYTTQDGGDSWDRILDPTGTGLQVASNTELLFANENEGWVTKDAPVIAKGPFIEKTTDGGYSWDTLFLPSPENLDFEDPDLFCKTYSPAFTSKQTRLLLLSCKDSEKEGTTQYVYATSDEGENWRYTELPSPVSELVFIDYQTGYALGRDIYKTENGGEDWEKIKTVYWDGQFSFVDEENGWAVVRKEGKIGFVYTRDGAQLFQLLDPIISP